MTNEEALKLATGLRTDFKCKSDTMVDFCNTIIKVLKQEPCEDCISREAVHDLIATWLSDYLTDETREALETIDGKVKDLPSVTPQPKTGHWIEDDFTGIIKCDICDNDAPISTVSGEQYCGNYCPNCGAKMESEE